MEDGEKADLGAEVLRVARHCEKRFGSGAEQDVVDHWLIAQSEGRDLFRDSEDEMKVLDRQQVGAPFGQPFGALLVLGKGRDERMLTRVEAFAEMAGKLSQAEIEERVPKFLAEIGQEMLRQ